MIRQIGLLDYDTLRTRYYTAPNYDLGILYAYLKQDKNINVRLISSLYPTNLKQYDKIYIFKQSKFIPHPSGYIQNYYKLPIEEYGTGFYEKPLRPFLLETRDMLPDFSCYNNMLRFSMDKPGNKIAWRIDKQAKGGKYKPLRLYEPFQGEELKKDYPTNKYNILYDDPVDILNNKEKFRYISELKNKGYRFLFAHPLDISLLKDTNIIEQVFLNSKYAFYRKRIIATRINDNVEWLIDKVLKKQISQTRTIMVKLPTEDGLEACLETMLTMNYYNQKTHFRVNLRPMWEEGYLADDNLALLAYRYLTDATFYMSYYEYVFNIVYLRMGVPKELIHTGEDRYEYILSQYGMPSSLQYLEKWLQTHPQLEEYVFIGGSSNYEKQRRKYYDNGRSEIAFRTSAYDTSEERRS